MHTVLQIPGSDMTEITSNISDLDRKAQRKRNFQYSLFGRLLRNPGGIIGSLIILIFVIIGLFSDQLMPYDPIKNYPKERLQAPSLQHPAGTDEMGRDAYSRLMKGASNSMAIAFASVAFAGIIGTILGAIAGYTGGAFDNVIMRLMDLIFSFPTMLLALAISTALGAGFLNTVIAIAIVYLPIFSRTARGTVLQIRECEYVDAARCIGAQDSRILFRHILPNALAPLIVQVSLGLSWAILTESSLSYLGLGTQPPNPSWGSMLSQARVMMELAPWLVIGPGVTIMLAVLGFNLLGDAIRDLMDPRLRSKGL